MLPILAPSSSGLGRCAAGLVLVLALAACSPAASQNAKSRARPFARALPATVLRVMPKRVPIVLDAIGQVQGSREVNVRARVSGILLKRLYTEGDKVRAGAPLFRIDTAPFRIALADAKAQLAQARARYEQARRDNRRLKKLAPEHAVSQKEYDDSVSALKLAAGALQAADAGLRQAELNLSYTLVKAPIAGVTGRALHSIGNLITVGQNNLLTTITQVDPIWVRFSLSESDRAKLPDSRLSQSTGIKVTLTLPDGSRYPIKGRINFVATQVDPQLATQEVRATFKNPQTRLLPGQFVRVHVDAGERNDVYLVPQTAVMQTEQGYLLFVLDKDNKARLRPVKTGDWVGPDWEILSGLKPGDRVVVDNLLKLRPGTTVAPIEGSQAKPGAAAAARHAGGAAN